MANPDTPMAEHHLDDYIACPDCDLLHRLRPLESRQLARCRRCNAVLYRGGSVNLQHLLAWLLTGLILLLVSNSYPILQLASQGQETHATFFQAAAAFAVQGMWWPAALVLLTSILIPFYRLGVLLLIALQSQLGRRLPIDSARLLLWHDWLAPWSMLEIFLLGLLVALVKLQDLAEVSPGIAFYAFFLLILNLAIISAQLDRRQLWRMTTQIRAGVKK
ncbi:MAG: paraquat-inducible protein A [Gammaproteobacteria bacterium]|nr:paraquat-inducible protein A [Gammaproteobacteria bacterium]MBU1653861.1 paraquat-inducible protein A [Gammaproteobacteria bacterium]MBU1960412.1 paraquat-inducible protein A [Gammaproteobacteria bacterium]